MYFPVVAVEFSVLAGCFNLLRVEKPRAIIIGICIQFAKLRKRFPSDISSLLESRNAIFQCKFWRYHDYREYIKKCVIVA